MFIFLWRLCSSLIFQTFVLMFYDGQVFCLSFGQMTKFWSFFWTNDQVLVPLNAHVHTLFVPS
jgi:hypothetical protein